MALPANADGAAAAPSTSLVISEVYGGGGNSGASYKRDFIELYNVSDQPIDLSGWQVEYFSAKSGNSGGVTQLSGTVAPGDYYLIAQAQGNGGTVDFEFDAEGKIAMGGKEGIVELSHNGTAVDLVGWGAAKRFEGEAAQATSNSTSAARTPVTQDTDNNKADFAIGEPTPQKSGNAASEPTETPKPTGTPEPTGTPQPTDTPKPTDPAQNVTPIVEVQGEGDKSPLVDQTVTVEGIVTAVYPTGGKNGFFIQAPGEADATRSSGVFIYGSKHAGSVKIGDSVSVTGKVSEYFGSTQISANSVSKLEQSLGEATPVKLDAWPATDAERERYEGMLLELSGDYTVTDNYGLNRYGEIGLAFGTKPLVQPTEVGAPDSAEAHAQAEYNAEHGVLLDDGATWDYTKNATAQNSPLPYLSLDKPVTVGSAATFTKPVVLDYGHDAWRLQPQQQIVGADSEWIPATFSDVREAAPAEVGGDITVGTFNVLNYFTALGEQENGCKFYADRQGNPTTTNYCRARGAYNAESFERQQAKIVAAINKLDASVIALEEIEDSADFGKERDAALAHLVSELNKDAGAEKWAYVASPKSIPATGDDVIRTAFIYQPAEVSYVDGSTEILDNPNFTNARAPLAATFSPVAKADQKFVMIVNHLKSKGGQGSGDNASFDKDDNPANNVGGWNGDRTRQAQAVVDFAAAQQQKQGTDLVFLAGDFNAYTMEDPVQTIIKAGYVQQVSEGEYSYLFGGLVGSLDHVFASPAAAKLVTGTDIWTINAYEPIALEYSRNNYNVTQLYAPDQFRASDHNPKLVGLQFEQAETGSLDVQFFRDHKLNNKLDDGELETGRSYVYVKDADGKWWMTTDTDGTYHFTGIAPGKAEVYFPIANPRSQYFNEADTSRLPQTEIKAAEATYIDAETGKTQPAKVLSGKYPMATVEVTADAPAKFVAGFSQARAVAKVLPEGSQQGSQDLAEVAFFDGTESVDAKFGSGNSDRYYAADTDGSEHKFLGDQIVLQVTAKDGYQVKGVMALDSVTPMNLTELGDGKYAVNRADLSESFGQVAFTVVVAEIPTGTPGPTVDPAEVKLTTDTSEYLLRGTVIFQGEGFTPGADVKIELHSTPVKVADVVADENGEIKGEFQVPAATEPGKHEVVAIESEDKTATADITVLEPKLEVNPVEASAVDSTAGFYVEGANWPANTELSFVVAGPNGYRAELTDVVTNEDGAFAQQLTWAKYDAEGNLIANNQEFPAGTYTVTVTDGEFTQEITFTVTASDTEPGQTDGGKPDTGKAPSGKGGMNSVDVTDKLATTGASDVTPLLVATFLVLAAGASLVALRRRNA